MKTYLVTGAAGFIGTNFIKYLLQKYSDIFIVAFGALWLSASIGVEKAVLEGKKI